MQRTMKGARVIQKTSPELAEVSGVVLFGANELGWEPTATHADLVVHATVDASTWKLEVIGPLGTWAQYVDQYGDNASGLASGAYVRVREGCWSLLRVTFATPGGGKVRVFGRTTGY